MSRTVVVASVTCLLACLLTLGASSAAQATTTSYYVSPQGSDRNPGTQAQPFRTLDRARNAARAVQRPLHGDIARELEDL